MKTRHYIALGMIAVMAAMYLFVGAYSIFGLIIAGVLLNWGEEPVETPLFDRFFVIVLSIAGAFLAFGLITLLIFYINGDLQ